MVALDLFVALQTHDFPNDQRIVLTEVLLQSYGPRKKPTVFLEPADIEHFTGLHRNNARSAAKALVTAQVLIAEADGGYRFNKDWEAWTVKGKTLADRLGGGLVRFARAAVGRFAKRNPSTPAPIQPDCEIPSASTDAPIQPDCEAIQLDSVTDVKLNPTGLTLQLSSQSSGIGPDAYTTGVRGNMSHAPAPASEDLKTEDKKTEDKQERAGASAGCPIPSPPGEWEQLESLARELMPGSTFSLMFMSKWSQEPEARARWLDWPFEAWREGVFRLARKTDPNVKHFHYYLGIVGGIAKEVKNGASLSPGSHPPARKSRIDAATDDMLDFFKQQAERRQSPQPRSGTDA